VIIGGGRDWGENDHVSDVPDKSKSTKFINTIYNGLTHNSVLTL
jgi:hypothetical protein